MKNLKKMSHSHAGVEVSVLLMNVNKYRIYKK